MTRDAPATILVVEDDAATRTFLADNLTADGYELLVADCARDGAAPAGDASSPTSRWSTSALPDGSGLDVLRPRARGRRRRQPRSIPTRRCSLLSGRAGELDRLRGFERGADDYVRKPFSYPELRGRVARAAAPGRRRGAPAASGSAALEIDPPRATVLLRGARSCCPRRSSRCCASLAGEPTRVWTKDELLRSVWGFRALGPTRTLDSHACRLRQKLGVHGDRYVVNVWGVGYRLVDGPGPSCTGRCGAAA